MLAVVREWQDDEGWGVVDCAATPGGCWVHFSAIEMIGFHLLQPGQQVRLRWEPARQNGFAFGAER